MKAESNGSIVSAETLVLPPKLVPVVSITLNLTERDAVALLTLCHRIGGNPTTTARGLFDQIGMLLDKTGIEYDLKSIESDKLHSIVMANYQEYS